MSMSKMFMERAMSTGKGKEYGDKFVSHVKKYFTVGTQECFNAYVIAFFAMKSVPLNSDDESAKERAKYIALTEDYHKTDEEAKKGPHTQLKQYKQIVADYERVWIPIVKDFKDRVTATMFAKVLEPLFEAIWKGCNENLLLARRSFMYAKMFFAGASIEAAEALMVCTYDAGIYAVATLGCKVDAKGKAIIPGKPEDYDKFKVANIPLLMTGEVPIACPSGVLYDIFTNDDDEYGVLGDTKIALGAAVGAVLDPLMLFQCTEYRIGSQNPTQKHKDVVEFVHKRILRIVQQAKDMGMDVDPGKVKELSFDSVSIKDDAGFKVYWEAQKALQGLVAKVRTMVNQGTMMAKTQDVRKVRSKSTITDADYTIGGTSLPRGDGSASEFLNAYVGEDEVLAKEEKERVKKMKAAAEAKRKKEKEAEENAAAEEKAERERKEKEAKDAAAKELKEKQDKLKGKVDKQKPNL